VRRLLRRDRRRLAHRPDPHHRALDARRAARLFGRLLCDNFAERFHERCFVEKRAGAGGLIGTAATAQAAPDGYTRRRRAPAYHVIAPAVSPNPASTRCATSPHRVYRRAPERVRGEPVARRAFAQGPGELGRRGRRSTTSRPASAQLGQLLAESFAQRTGIKLQQIMTRGALAGLMDLVAGTVHVAP